jgi:hypothetical protein
MTRPPPTAAAAADTARWAALLEPFLRGKSDTVVRDLFQVHIRTARAILAGHCPGIGAIHKRMARALGIAWNDYAATLPAKIKPRRRRRRGITVMRRELEALRSLKTAPTRSP